MLYWNAQKIKSTFVGDEYVTMQRMSAQQATHFWLFLSKHCDSEVNVMLKSNI